MLACFTSASSFPLCCAQNTKYALSTLPTCSICCKKSVTCIRSIINFFLKFLADTHVLFGATGTPVLDFWWCLLWGSKPEWGSALLAFCRGECNVHSLRSTFGATLVDLLAASAQPSPVPTYCCRSEVAGIRTCALRISVSQTLYQLS